MTSTNRIEGDSRVNIGGRATPAGTWRARHVAAYLGIHLTTVERWRSRKGAGPPFRRMTGGRHGRVLYSPEIVKAWVRGEVERGADDRPVWLEPAQS